MIYNNRYACLRQTSIFHHPASFWSWKVAKLCINEFPGQKSWKEYSRPKGANAKSFVYKRGLVKFARLHDVIMQLQILVTALTSVMKTLGSTSSVYFCCVLALTLFSVPPAGSSFSSSGRWRRCASIVMAHGIRYGLCRYSHDRKGLFLDFQKSPFFRFNMARDEVQPLATSSYA